VGVLLWDAAIARAVWWWAYHDRISWRVPPRKIKMAKDGLTRDWRPML
jgi:hypothetical protein